MMYRINVRKNSCSDIERDVTMNIMLNAMNHHIYSIYQYKCNYTNTCYIIFLYCCHILLYNTILFHKSMHHANIFHYCHTVCDRLELCTLLLTYIAQGKVL